MQVSILMPVYNEALYLEEAVESVANQGGDLSYELICVDDFSTDTTWDVMVELKNKYSFLKCFRNSCKGKNNAFNLAYANSSGVVVMLLAGDDKLVANTIACRAEPVLRTDKCCISLCKYKTFSQTDFLHGIVSPKNKNMGSLSGGTVAFNRVFADIIFPIPIVLGNEDMWIKCHATYSDDVDIYHVPAISLLYRLHESNSLKRNVSFSEKNRMVSSRAIVYSVFLEKYRGGLSEESRRSLSMLAALETLRANRSIASIIFFRNVGFIEKARAVVYASRVLHWVHVRMLRWTSGN